MTISTATVSGQILTSAYVNNNINSGKVWIKETTLATTTDITSCFSAAYTTYDIVCNITSAGSGGASTLSGQLLLASTPLAGTGYSYTLSQQSYSSGTFVVSQAASTSSWVVGRCDAASSNAIFTMTIVNPFVATEPTQFTSRWVDNTTTGNTGGINTSVSSYDGLRITGMTSPVGTVTVYGYRQS